MIFIRKILFGGLPNHCRYLGKLLKLIRLKNTALFKYLLPYYLITLLNGVFDGLSVLMLVKFFSGEIDRSNGLLSYVEELCCKFNDTENHLIFLTAVLGLALVTRLMLYLMDAQFNAYLRREIQKGIYHHLLKVDWSLSRNFQIGSSVGLVVQDGLVAAKYVMSAVTVSYAVIMAAVLTTVALFTNIWAFIVLTVIALPILMFVKLIFFVQTRYSREGAIIRNKFSADISDRFSGHLQIHAESNYTYHMEKGLEKQARLRDLDIYIGVCQSFIGSFNLLAPFFGLLCASLYIFFIDGRSGGIDYVMYAGVGLLGVKIINQINSAISSLGDLSRLSGSVALILDLFKQPLIKERKLIQEDIHKINLRQVTYCYDRQFLLPKTNIEIYKGVPIILMGPSGAGKTTLANLVAGIYLPTDGLVEYVGQSGCNYSSVDYRPVIGYVTQDIYLFAGSLREVLTSNQNISDHEIYGALKLVGAYEFVIQLGGLDSKIVEGGRLFSGGQRRRLGIAKALLCKASVLIFDEITAGLDIENKKLIVDLVNLLAKSHILIFITHENISLKNQIVYEVG